MITQTLKGYRAADLPKDLMAGLVIAALSIPIAMGYAEVVGLPAIYGLWASIAAPAGYALFSSTRRVVFGMDSAAAAMTASMLATIGLASPDAIIAAMPWLTLLTALFLLLLGLARAGRFVQRVPQPVVHGFIFGIALTVVAGQVPLLLGTTADMTGNVVEKTAALAACLPRASVACVLVSAACIAALYLLKRFAPVVPAAIVVLVGAALVCNGLAAAGVAVPFLPEVTGSLPSLASLSPAGQPVGALLLASFAIAAVVSLESLLCVETFGGTTPAPSPDTEMRAFGLANALVGLIGCPPCSASLSRTAAGAASGATSPLASVFSALIVAAVAAFAGSFMNLLPRCALAAIVVVALIDLVDFGKIRSYATKTRREFLVFVISAALVVLLGAVAGILGGFILSLALRSARERIASSGPELLGAVPYAPDDLPAKKDIDVGYELGTVKLSGDLSFMNIAKALGEVERAATGKQALIVKLSKLDTIDTTAADKLEDALDALMERGAHVKLVRPIKETADHYTRYELRRLMGNFKFYPSVKTAMLSLAEEHAAGVGPQRPDTWLEGKPAPRRRVKTVEGRLIVEGDRPVVAIAGLRNLAGDVLESDGEPFLEDIHGKLSFMQSRRAFQFSADYLEGAARGCADENGHFFSKLLLWDETTDEVLIDYRAGTMRTCHDEVDAVALMEPIDRTIQGFALTR